MSLKSERTKTANHLRNARNAIIGRGGEISATAGLKDLPEAIANIPNDQTLAYQKVLNSTSRIIVPQSVKPMAVINKIGGMSYKRSNNVLSPADIDISHTWDGMTFTNNGDGSVTFNGEGYVSFCFRSWELPRISNASDYYIAVNQPIPEGCYLYVWCYSTSDLEETDSENPTVLYAGETQIRISSGNYIGGIEFVSDGYVKLSNFTLKPTLSNGAYTEWIENSKTTSIVSKGANLIPYPFDFSTYSNSGVTFTVNENQSITVSGEATANTSVTVIKTGTITAKAGETYTISYSGNWGSSKGYVAVMEKVGQTTIQTTFVYTTAKTFTVVQDCSLSIIIVAKAGKTFGEDIKIMLNRGTTEQPFKTYKGIIGAAEIPDSVQNLEGYGEGVDADYYNYIEWRDGRCYFVQTCKKIVFDGVTEGWYANSLIGTENCFFALELYSNRNVIPNGISYKNAFMNDYNYAGIANTTTDIGWNFITNEKFLLRVRPTNVATKFLTLDAWKSYLAERYANGNPLEFIYALAEPIETDITDLMTIDNAIAVEGGGSIEFVNEHSNDIPSETSYLINTAGG